MVGMEQPHYPVRTRVMRLVMCSVFVVAVAAVTPATALAEASTSSKAPKPMGYTGRYGKTNLGDRNDSAAYFGNWGYAPGGYYWNPNDLWHRSRGFWDTNAPGCPFRSC